MSEKTPLPQLRIPKSSSLLDADGNLAARPSPAAPERASQAARRDWTRKIAKEVDDCAKKLGNTGRGAISRAVREIAEKYRIEPRTVYTHLSRARKEAADCGKNHITESE